MKHKILALDAGTTSCRTILFDESAIAISSAQKEFNQLFPQPSWVEHDPNEIFQTQLETMRCVLSQSGTEIDEIAIIGIANQRETTILWDADTMEPICNAIVWQCRRTADICDELLNDHDLSEMIHETTGLVIDAYFSATKIMWMLEHIPGARELADAGKLRFGTVDTWLIYKFSCGKYHVTDYTNASRTMLYDIHNLCWSETICRKLSIPMSILPVVVDSSGINSYIDSSFFGREIPIGGIAGDQQAALFGQGCFAKGEAKNTYGTGCFLLMNTGDSPVQSKHGLVSTIAWGIGGKITYALEGSVFIAGAIIQWLRDKLGIIEHASESYDHAIKINDSEGVYVVPAFAGLGAPYWDMHAQGIICGLTRATTKSHIVRAALESIAFQSYELLEAVQQDSGIMLKELMVDGGACNNDFLIQFQADILSQNVNRPKNTESTALGAAYLAGLACGIFRSFKELRNVRQTDRLFEPEMDEDKRKTKINGWKVAVSMCMSHQKNEE